MTNRKSQNSILFLTTLGVYLGLVLVGATPQVLAQAATAKQFSVRDEIGQKDEFDNDPDECKIVALRDKIRDLETSYLWYNHGSVSEHRHLVEQLLNEYLDVAAYNVNWRTVDNVRHPLRAVTTTTDFVGSDKSVHEFDSEVVVVGNGLPGESFSFSAAKDASGYTFKFDSNGFTYDSPLVRYLYNTALDFQRCVSSYEVSDAILRNTEVKVERNNLIITTRLPRGALDSLLATDAK